MKYTVFADGASRGNPGPASCGAVVEREGEVVHEISEAIGEETNNVAEYMAVIKSFEYLITCDDIDSVIVYLDSKLVVEQASGRWKVKQDHIKVLHGKLTALLLQADFSYVFEHVVREKNTRADALANAALDAL